MAAEPTENLAPFTVDELAALLRVERKTVYAMAQRNEIPGAIRAGRLLRFARPAVVAWLSEGQRPPRARGHR